jgi:hypothetical protein
MTNNWAVMGRLGAEEYLNRYGRNIGSAKLVKMAIYAGQKGYPDFANVMWEKAFKKDHPNLPFHSSDPVVPGSSAADLPDIFHT